MVSMDERLRPVAFVWFLLDSIRLAIPQERVRHRLLRFVDRQVIYERVLHVNRLATWLDDDATLMEPHSGYWV